MGCDRAERIGLRAHRRGIAMLLVLVAMVVAVVLTSAAIVSRDTAPAMGANATASVDAAWGAESAANYAVGVLANGFDWSAAIGSDGTFVDSMAVGAATVHVTLTDLEGNVQDADDRDLIMTATATVNGISTTVQRMVSLGEPGDPIDAIDPLFGEFTLLGVSELSVASGARLGVWSLSPEAAARPQAKLGTVFQQAGNLSVSLAGAMGPVEMHVDAHGDAGLAAEAAATAYSLEWQMLVQLPVLMDWAPSSVTGALTARGDYQPANNAVETMAAGAYGQVQIQNSALVTLDGTAPIAVRCDRLIMDGAKIRIVGDVTLMVRDRLRMNNSAQILLADADARLTVYVGNEFELDGSCQLGVVASDSGRAALALSEWVDPGQVRLIELDPSQGGSGIVTMNVLNGSTVLGSIHAPGATLEVQSGSTLIGRATADVVSIDATGTVLYDPSLDNRVGFTNPNGPLYVDVLTVDPVVEAAMDDAITSGATTVDSYLVQLRTAYTNQLALVGGDLAAATESAVQGTTSIFKGLLGIQ